MTEPSGRRSEPDSGVTAVEYALLIALVAAAIFAAVVALGLDVIELFERVNWWDN